MQRRGGFAFDDAKVGKQKIPGKEKPCRGNFWESCANIAKLLETF